MIIGISGIFVNYFILFITFDLLGLLIAISVALAIITSMTTNYVLNRSWTFRSKNPLIAEYIRYLMTNAIGAFIQYFMTLFVVYLLLIFGYTNFDLNIINYSLSIATVYIATLFGIASGFLSNFLFSKYFVFVKKQDKI
jgi:putative flippase GtrA